MATIKTNNSSTLLYDTAFALQYAFSYGITGMIASQVYQLEGNDLNWGFPSTSMTAGNRILKSITYRDTPARDSEGNSVGFANGSRKAELTGSNYSYSKLTWEDNYSITAKQTGYTSKEAHKDSITASLSLQKFGSGKPLSISQAQSKYSYTKDTSFNGDSSSSKEAGTLMFLGKAEYRKNAGNSSLQSLTIKQYTDNYSSSQVEKNKTSQGIQNQTTSASYNFTLSSKNGLTFDAGTGLFTSTSALDSLTYVSKNASSLSPTENHNGSFQTSAVSNDVLTELSAYLTGTRSLLDVQLALLAGDDVITGTDKTHNWLFGGGGNDKITGNAGSDELYGGDGDDQLFGLAGDDLLFGGAGNDLLDGGKGVDTMIGGSGDDIYILDDHRELERINQHEGDIYQDPGIDTLRITYKSAPKTPLVVDLNAANLLEIENVQLIGTGSFEVLGNALDNRLDAGNGASVLRGGAGDDTYIVGHKDARVFEAANQGTDTVIASVSFILGANIENLTLLGKAALNGTGNELVNLLIGNDGNNILDGGLNTTGFDTLRGGKGNDTYIVRNVGDIVEEEANAGIDTVKAYFNYALTSNVENLILEGSDHINGTGNDLKNVITGNAGNNVLDGGAGIDKLIGGKGNDTYIVDLITKGVGTKATVALEDSVIEKPNEGNDTLILRVSDDVLAKLAEASKATTLTLAANLENLDASLTGNLNLNLTGNKDNNIIIGNSGNNILNGGAGDDTLYAGEGGNNILIGGAGADVMHGGSGQDTFRFTSLKDLGLGEGKQDVIWNFTQGEDKLDFSLLKGWSFKGTGEAFAATGTKQLWAEQDGDDLMLYGNSAGSVDADFSIKLVGISGLSADDFILS
ncbi:Ca2+-binding RTX toxin-like protein [Ectopseudomonas oleovorans]|uniref:Ca2+-binding RTX toxin-like protein n=1 Tax=Ectopseudomonas oleovorans TaxID=301 RepID=A0A397M9X1_ECTOL|nr:calcium-binding protein [Pseudomonas oleovorans]RIA20489.1 Ca2+-binding RTX toxin-like protein [Pseudomonas oleovorans]